MGTKSASRAGGRSPVRKGFPTAAAACRRLKVFGSPERARVSRSFFKTGRGQYGEGDRFLGVTVPEIRTLSKEFRDLPRPEILLLLKSPLHEARLLALLLMVRICQLGDDLERGEMFDLYLSHTAFVNNWDLVDLSAPYLVGPYLETRSRRILYRLAKSNSLWERRIAILSTLHFIRQGDFTDALAISQLLLTDGHDLIHKAVGWMLREVGKRDLGAEEAFLMAHYSTMPRTSLRYSIERFSEDKRRAYLKGAI